MYMDVVDTCPHTEGVDDHIHALVLGVRLGHLCHVMQRLDQ